MVTLPELYPHQDAQMIQPLRRSLAKHRAVILQAEPGTGKTRCAKWMMGRASERDVPEGHSGHSLFAVHRRSLVDNASDSFAEEPELSHGVLMSGIESHLEPRTQVASIDTLLSWFVEHTYNWDVAFDLIVFDECHSHHQKLQTFLSAHNAKRDELGLKPPYVIGLSATPQAPGLSEIYQDIVRGPTAQWLIANKYLSPFRYFAATQGKLGRLVRRGDEYTSDSVTSAMEGLSGSMVRDWQRLGEGRATVGFFPRLTQAKEAQETLCAAGVRAEYVDGTTSDDRRHRLYKWLRTGVIDYICNVGVIERGTDIPAIGCIQLCTAIGNVVRYRQMIGRGSRVHDSVADCIVIDHGGNLRHGFFEDAINWTLDWSHRPAKDHDARPAIECPQCHRVYRGGACVCGYEPTVRERRAVGLEFDGRQLREYKPGDRVPKKQISNERQLIAALYACGNSNRTWKQALAIAYRNARSRGQEFHVPAKFEVGGKLYKSVRRDSPDAGRRVAALYPFTVTRRKENASA